MKSTTDWITEICSKTQNPSLCLQTLPRPSGGDRKALGQISINMTQTNAKQTSNLITSLSKQATDPKLRNIHSMCAENYKDAINNLNQAKNAMNSGDFDGMNAKASAAETDSSICEDGFQRTPKPFQLQQANKKVSELL
ncbi:hypothetical protein CsSME_00032992 [Camellia sinensis var. sinensis]|uniref:Pectinesterase inhibitor domain-containing protein n=2 Tax=Camellia sinensis TaxID=4442 RepID=A0A4S4EED2_CAMSN|nr:hypothetical protein TEA_021857 [Camellia sinensis var. sinensis]